MCVCVCVSSYMSKKNSEYKMEKMRIFVCTNEREFIAQWKCVCVCFLRAGMVRAHSVYNSVSLISERDNTVHSTSHASSHTYLWVN